MLLKKIMLRVCPPHVKPNLHTGCSVSDSATINRTNIVASSSITKIKTVSRRFSIQKYRHCLPETNNRTTLEMNDLTQE